MPDVGVMDSGLAPPSRHEWLQTLASLGAAQGAFSPLGLSHWALLVRAKPTLLVTFETVKGIRSRGDGQMPFGLDVAGARGWSSLTLIANHDTWFRDPAVYAYFDRLIDEGFFDGFDQVVFYGAGMAGYAAAAFSVAAPGATVVAIQPQATLNPTLAGWDPRFAEMRRTAFTDRYGFAPDMIEGAASVFVVYDPEQVLDAMHAALFARPWVTLLPCPHLGRDIAEALEGMSALPSILLAAGTGTLDTALFRAFYRARRNHIPYLANLLARLDTDGRPLLGALLCRNVAGRLRDPRFARRLAELERQLRQSGTPLPAARL